MIYLDFQYNTHTLPNTKSVECESVKISQKTKSKFNVIIITNIQSIKLKL